uniref:Putative ovule protein n=1 Tax=Solanum chacoense TaxID=4108 RepID=A0A0V0GVX5_SOLCH
MLAAMTDFKAFELIRVLAWQSLVSFPPSPDHPFSEMTDELPLFLFLLLSLLCFINDEDVEVLSSVEVQ